MTQNEIVRVTGLSPATVSYHLELAKADTATLDQVRARHLPVGAVHEAIIEPTGLRTRPAPGAAAAPRPPRPKPPVHFGAAHPLAARARARCLRLRHPAREHLGQVACGPCFEAVIRDDAVHGAGPSTMMIRCWMSAARDQTPTWARSAGRRRGR